MYICNMFDISRTRKGKLRGKIELVLNQDTPDIDEIINHIDDYEQDNLETIKKLSRKKIALIKRINGALKQTIHAHGPITKEFIGSASKRIYGALLEEKKENIFKRFYKWLKK